VQCAGTLTQPRGQQRRQLGLGQVWVPAAKLLALQLDAELVEFERKLQATSSGS